MCARNCQTICTSAKQSKLEPENAYLLTSATPAKRLLKTLALLDPRRFGTELKAACRERDQRAKSGDFDTSDSTSPPHVKRRTVSNEEGFDA